MRRTIATAALIGLIAACGSGAWAADAVPTNDADSLTVTITPNIDRGVSIDTSAVVMDLGSVELYTATQTVTPATVTILGTWATQELNMTGSIVGGWSFDATPSTDATNGEFDAVAVYALFSDPSLSTAPNGDDFADVTAAAGYTGGTQRVGGIAGDGTRFEKQGGGNKDMDNMNPGNTAHLWMFLRMPDATSTSASQNVTLTLTAADAS